MRRGFFLLVGAIVAALALGTAAAANAGYDPSAAGGRAPIWLALSLGGATLVWLALLAVRRPALARIVGALTVPLAIAMLGAFARASHESAGLTFFQLRPPSKEGDTTTSPSQASPAALKL